MNTDFAQNIKNQRDNIDINQLLSRPTLTSYENKLAKGEHVFPIAYTLFLSNALIYAARNNLIQCKKFFVGSIFASLPLAYFTCYYLFGYDKLRRIIKIEEETLNSALLYEYSTMNLDRKQ